MRRQTILILWAGLAAGPAAAQGFGWLFDEPPPGRRTPRVRRPRAAVADVPLPVPRPDFPGDLKPPAALAQAAEPPPPAQGQAEAAAAGPSTPPLPPERPPPAELQAAPATAPIEKHKGDAAAAGTSQTKETAAPPAAPSTPPVAASGATTAFDPRQPAEDIGCADRLAARGVITEPVSLPPQPDPRCTVVQPMRLVSAKLEDGATASFPDKPTIACTTADAFSAYVHDLLAPLAKGTWGVDLASVWTGPGLECRSRDHVFGAKLSAHGQGLAVDIAQMKLGDGRIVAVGEPKTDSERSFETAARAGGCGYFHTVLGPGSDSYHRTHWHFDLEVRGRDGDGKYCK